MAFSRPWSGNGRAATAANADLTSRVHKGKTSPDNANFTPIVNAFFRAFLGTAFWDDPGG